MAVRSAAVSALDPAQQRTLTALLDELVPARPELELPGAGGLDLADAVARAAAGNPALASVLADTLAQLAERATQRGGASFAELEPEDRRAALDELAGRAPGHLPALCFLTFAAYYQEPRVLAAIGHPARPPYPIGFEVPETDFSLLDTVRRRAPFYRRL